jgi:hypothetical protein
MIVAMERAVQWTEKREAEQVIRFAVDRIRAARREPDAWEAMHLLDAIHAVARRHYSLAIAVAETAHLPPEERVGLWPRQPDTPSISDLDRALASVAESDPN